MGVKSWTVKKMGEVLSVVATLRTGRGGCFTNAVQIRGEKGRVAVAAETRKLATGPARKREFRRVGFG